MIPFSHRVGVACRVEELRPIFEKYGTIKDIYMPRGESIVRLILLRALPNHPFPFHTIDFYTRKPKGYAYIEFGAPEEAEAAMSKIEVR